MKYTSQPPALSERMRNVTPSATLALAQKARELAAKGHDVVSLTAGEPDRPPAPHIIDAMKGALDRGWTRYTAVNGIEDLRRAVVKRAREQDQLDYELTEVIITPGAKHAIYSALEALVGPGDEVVLVAPYWLSYRDMVHLAEATPVVVDTRAEEGFLLRPETLEAAITDRTKVLLLNSPSNPTGAAYTKEELAGLAEVLRRHPRILVISDEIYRLFTYEASAKTTLLQAAPDLVERVIVVDGVSKSYAMTGLRIGWALGPRAVISAMGKVQGQSTSNPSSISQYGALAALTGDQRWIERMVDEFDGRRRMVLQRLNAMPGLSCFSPKGAFYAFPSLEGLKGKRFENGDEVEDALGLTEHLVKAQKLVLVPGNPFGAPDHFRISYAADTNTLKKGLDRLEAALSTLS